MSYGLTDIQLRRLYSQSRMPPPYWSRELGNASTSLLTPVLRDVHWLPVGRRVDCKIALLVYKSLHGLAPNLSQNCRLVSSDTFHCLRLAADVDTCTVSRTQTRFGDRSFTVAGPRLTGTVYRLPCVVLKVTLNWVNSNDC